jgi:hypothetical protein
VYAEKRRVGTRRGIQKWREEREIGRIEERVKYEVKQDYSKYVIRRKVLMKHRLWNMHGCSRAGKKKKHVASPVSSS